MKPERSSFNSILVLILISRVITKLSIYESPNTLRKETFQYEDVSQHE